MSKEEIKAQFDSVVKLLKEQTSTLPESTVALFNLMISLVNMLLEAFDSLKQTVENQSKIIQGREADHELIKSLKTLLKECTYKLWVFSIGDIISYV